MILPTEAGDQLNTLALKFHNDCITDAIYDSPRFIEINLEFNESQSQAILSVDCSGWSSSHLFVKSPEGWHNRDNMVVENDLARHTRYGKTSVSVGKCWNNLVHVFGRMRLRAGL